MNSMLLIGKTITFAPLRVGNPVYHWFSWAIELNALLSASAGYNPEGLFLVSNAS
jgi:hypothetical protein